MLSLKLLKKQTINKSFEEVLNDEYPKQITLPPKKEPLGIEYIPSPVDVKTSPYARTQLRHGVLTNGKEYLLDIKDGKVVKLINGEGDYTENELKIAKFLNKWNIK